MIPGARGSRALGLARAGSGVAAGHTSPQRLLMLTYSSSRGRTSIRRPDDKPQQIRGRGNENPCVCDEARRLKGLGKYKSVPLCSQ